MLSCRLKALEQSKKYIGVKEHPPGSNRGPHIDRWTKWATERRFPKTGGITGYPWCAAFVCGMVRESCKLIVPEPKQAAVGFLEAWAKRVGSLLKPGVRPRKGDWVCYNFDSDNWPDHIGIIDKVIAVRWFNGHFIGTIRTVEGNTSAGNNANGGQVQVRYRSARRCKFIRIDAKKLRRAP